MNENNILFPETAAPINILLADDDFDDRYFFEMVLKKLPLRTTLSTVDNGEKLMIYLFENAEKLPDVLFLDLNMPRKNGAECLTTIKDNEKLKHLPVIIYSTLMREKDEANLYRNGAHYYIQKTDIIKLEKILYRILAHLIESKFARPSEDKFVFSLMSRIR